jgi:hypothetical protein
VEVVEGGVKTTKVKNYSILLKKEKYLKKALKVLEQVPDDKDKNQALMKILTQRRGGEILNIEFKLDKALELKNTLSPEQLEKITYKDRKEIKVLGNLQQIDLALNHGIYAETLASAELAFSGKFSALSHQYILTGRDQDQKNELAEKLAGIRYREPLIGLLKYGIEAKSGNPLALASELFAKTSLLAIEDVYSHAPGDHQAKQKAAQQFYQ